MKQAALIILNYQDAERTASLVRKVSSYRVPERIVVVDNASSDDSFRVLCALKEENHIDVIRTEKNVGYARGNNFGIRYAIRHFHPDILLIANPDVSFDESAAKTLVSVLRSHPEFAVAAPLVRQGFNVWTLPDFPGILESLLLFSFNLHKALIRKKLLKAPGRIIPVGVVEGSFFALSAKAFTDIGGFDPRTFLYAEEIMLSYRLVKAGYGECICRDIRYDHLHSASIKKLYRSSKAGAFHHFRDSFRIYNRYYLHTSALQDAVFDLVYAFGLLERKLFDAVHHVRP